MSWAKALIVLEGYGAVQVFSENAGLLLLECAIPGTSLKSYFPEKDDEAINITANVIKRLHKAPIPSAYVFPHIKDWLAALAGDLKIPAQYLQKARTLCDQLLKTAGPDVLLHGDLHHDNILQNGKTWVVIDPKGVIGELAYEVVAFIKNPIPDLLSVQNAAEIIQNRIALFSDSLNIPKARIAGWCFVQVVLAWIWALEDNCETSCFEKLTRLFDGIHLNM